jgi:hypothetical protein
MTALALVPLLGLTKEERLILWTGVLLGVLVIGAVFIARLDRWRKRQLEGADDPDLVMSFRELYERGEISKEEYGRVLRRVAERVGARPKPVPVPPAAPQEPAAGPPATEEPPAPPPG